MKLTELDAYFISYHRGEFFRRVDTLAEADGVMYQCPKCSENLERGNGFVIGAHSIICWFAGKVLDDVYPGPGRWNPSGSTLSDLTLTPSVLLKSCGWHGYVTNGEAK